MKAIIINGSPRKNWNTDKALQRAAEGLKAAYQMGVRLAEEAKKIQAQSRRKVTRIQTSAL